MPERSLLCKSVLTFCCFLGIVLNTTSISDPLPALKPYGAAVNGQGGRSQQGVVARRNSLADDRPKIVKPTSVSAGEFPWIVALVYFEGTGANRKLKQYCGGAIIDDLWVVTAAHCEVQEGDLVLSGMTVLPERLEDQSSLPTVKKVFLPNEPFDTVTYKDDFALIWLSKPIRGSHIDLTNNSKVESVDGTPMIIAGWGATSFGGESSRTLFKGSVTTKDTQDCSAAYGATPFSIADSMFCAKAGESDACTGDSGGPAIMKDPSAPTGFSLLGIISWGKDCGQKAYPGVYTRMSKFSKWVGSQRSLHQNAPIPLNRSSGKA